MLSGEEEEMVNCPYNFSHVILKSRMPAHLIKCRQQHDIEKFTTCPFNSTHDVPELEIQYHTQTCPDRKNLENYVYIIGDSKPSQDVIPQLDVPVSSENWDEDEVAVASYLQVKDKKLEDERVFRNPTGMSKGQKKAFYKSEVLKFGKVSGEQSDTASASKTDSAGGANQNQVERRKKMATLPEGPNSFGMDK